VLPHFNVRILFPQAPKRAVAVYKDEIMRSWYNLFMHDGVTLTRDDVQLKQSTDSIHELIH